MRGLPCDTILRRRAALVIVLLVAGAFHAGCSGGIDPADYAGSASISGRVRFVRGAGPQNFPPKDSLYDLRVVAFKMIPRDTNLVQTLAQGEAFFSTSLLDTSYKAEMPFTFDVPQVQIADSSVLLQYIAVGQQYGSNLFSDWRVVGLYSMDSLFTPRSLRATPGLIVDTMTIDVDFLRIPPQPFIR
jgi:hypothetical protein